MFIRAAGSGGWLPRWSRWEGINGSCKVQQNRAPSKANFRASEVFGDDYCNSCTVGVAQVLSGLSYVNFKVLLSMVEKAC